MGTHAFDWTIYVEESTGNMTITTCQKFSKGEQARKRFQELKKKLSEDNMNSILIMVLSGE